jgi:hypothetical protein
MKIQKVIILIFFSVFFGIPCAGQDKADATNYENKARQQKYWKSLACLVSISGNEVIWAELRSRYDVPDTDVEVDCSRGPDWLLSEYGKLVERETRIDERKDQGKTTRFSLACLQTEKIFPKPKPCPEKLIELLMTDSQQVKLELRETKIASDNQKLQKQAEDKTRSEMMTKGKEIDTVASVLNYSSGCPDDGCKEVSWYQKEKGTCKYHKIDKSDGTVKAEIDLNDYDPKSIKIGIEQRDISNLPSRKVFREFTVISYDGRTLISTFGRLDTERILRGWSLIYSKHCKGKQRAF